MKLEEADKRLLNLLCLPSLDVRLSADDLNAFEKMRSYVEATRWRKLSEEKPTKNGLYEVLSITHFSFRCEWIKESNSFIATEGVKWWRPIVGPEEEE